MTEISWGNLRDSKLQRLAPKLSRMGQISGIAAGCHGLVTPHRESAGPGWEERRGLSPAFAQSLHCNTEPAISQLVMKDRDVIWQGWWYLPRVRVAAGTGLLRRYILAACSGSAITQLGAQQCSGWVFMLDYEAGPLSPKVVIRKAQK